MDPKGTIVYVTVGIPHYGFDVFSVDVTASADALPSTETRHTDGISVNFNAQFTSAGSVVFVSDRSGCHKLYITADSTKPPTLLPSIPDSLFHDRPVIHGDCLFFASAHEPPTEHLRSWSAVYSTDLRTNHTTRLTPPGTADISPAVSPSGDLIAVASYGASSWKGDFRVLETEITVFRAHSPDNRAVVATTGGWPCWYTDSTVCFHRKADDGWWSIFAVDLASDVLGAASEPRRITPPGIHSFTPAASGNGRRIAVATRRKGRTTRQIEMFDLEERRFLPVTELISSHLHHYNPFFSVDSSSLGYHRFRGESPDGIVPHLRRVASPVAGLRLLRLNGTFPSVSLDRDLIAMNGDFLGSPGLMVVKSDGSRRWTLIKDPAVFSTAWSPAEKGVLFASVGPIFESVRTTVQIARIQFDLKDLHEETENMEVEVRILTDEDTGNNAFPSCSPDGKWVVYRSGRSGHKNLYVMDAVRGEKGGIRRLTEGDWIDTMPSWSPCGNLIAFSSNRHVPESADFFSIYLVLPDGSGVKRVYVAGPEGSALADRERVNHVCFSPDGEWLAFTANFGAITVEPVSMPNQFQPYGDLYVCRLDGSNLRRLTTDGYENGTPAWMDWDADKEIGRLSLNEYVGDRLTGQIEEPLWLTCDI